MRSLRVSVGHLASYSISLYLPAILNILSTPIIIKLFGLSTWNQIVVSQSVGSILAVIIQCGWNIKGPTIASLTDRKNLRDILIRSFVTRVAAFMIVCPIGVFILTKIVSLNPISFLAYFSTISTSLLSTWYYTSQLLSKTLFIRDTFPRNVCVLLGLTLCYLLKSVEIYLLGILFGIILSLAFNIEKKDIIQYKRMIAYTKPRIVFNEFNIQKDSIISSLTITSYTYLPTIIFQIYNPVAAPIYNLLLRIIRMFVLIFLPFNQLFQGFIGNSKSKLKTLNQSFFSACLLSLGISIFALFVFDFSIYFFSGLEYSFDCATKAGISLIIFSICMSQYIGITELTALKNFRGLYISTTAASVVGLPSLIFGAVNFRINTIIWILFFIEITVLLIQTKFSFQSRKIEFGRIR